MKTGPTNEFNALSDLSPVVQLRLMNLASSGNSPVSNAFTQEADRLGLTPKGRERKEAEEQRRQRSLQTVLAEQSARFQERLHLLEQATADALRENEERLLAAREELARVRDRAYEITMPDGKIAKVYRDGDKVRDDAGAIVDSSVIHPSEIPGSAPDWATRQRAGERLDAARAERDALETYQKKLQTAREKFEGGTLSSDDLNDLSERLQKDVPSGVQKHLELSRPFHAPAEREAKAPSTFLQTFGEAAQGARAPVVLSDADFDERPKPKLSPSPN